MTDGNDVTKPAAKEAVTATGSSKAMMAGGMSALAGPMYDVIQWMLMTYTPMPETVAFSAAIVLCGVLGWGATYLIPNRPVIG